jgi:uncharacterized coiled-coil DUF342 family protein
VLGREPEDVFEEFQERLQDLREIKQRRRDIFEDINDLRAQYEDIVDKLQAMRKDLKVLDRGGLKSKESIQA